MSHLIFGNKSEVNCTDKALLYCFLSEENIRNILSLSLQNYFSFFKKYS
jgi:hypothetical protein